MVLLHSPRRLSTSRFKLFRRQATRTLFSLSMALILSPAPTAFAIDTKVSPTDRIAAANSPATLPKKTATSEESSFKLPTSVLPISYELSFTPNLQTFVFDGQETVLINVTQPSKTVTLNSLDIEIKTAEISPAETGSPSDATKGVVTLDLEHELARIEFPKPLTPGKYKLNIAFTGTLNDKLRGFYRSHYADEKGVKHWLATTQMEPTDARRMFPSFDEPEMKATFKISTTIDSNLTAISNAPVEREVPEGSKKTIHFEPSPKMSSYLVALIIGDFKSTEVKTARGIPIRVWAPAGKERLGNYALDAACKILDYQSEYFGIPYPAKKLDLIAIPDFRSGAMENLGAITFREASLLVDEKTGSSFLKRRCTDVVAHEIAHQWFGDLVTMKWWDDIWLNEAFASWMGTKTVNVIHPDWEEETKAANTRNGAMEIDQLSVTRAIHADVADPKQAAEMFDPITYDKGESVLGMLETFVGVKEFQGGIHDYLLNAQFGNATSEDLWRAIGAKTKYPVPGIMKTWVFQAGFPVVSVKHNGDKIEFSQERFLSAADQMPGSTLWDVPLALRYLDAAPGTKGTKDTRETKDARIFSHLLNKKQDFLDSAESKPLPLIVNAGGNGFYRVHYDENDLNQILAKFDELSPKERLVLLNDISAEVLKGSLPVERRLDFILRAASERNPIAQELMVSNCQSPFFILSQSGKEAYRKILAKSLLPIKKQLEWNEKPGEADAYKDLRAAALGVLGTIAQDQNTIAEARALFAKYKENRESVPANITRTVLNIVAYNGGDEEYKQFLEIWKKETIPELEKRIFNSLSSFKKPEQIDQTLKLVMSNEVRSQDGFGLLASELMDSESNEQTWTFLKAHWDEVSKKFPPRSLAQIAFACRNFDTSEQENDLKTFFSSHPLSYGKAAVSRMLETVHQSVLFRQRNQAKIEKWAIDQAALLK